MGRASRWLRSIFTKSGNDGHHNNNNNRSTSKTNWIANLVKPCGDNSRGAADSNKSLRGGRIARDDSASRSSECYAIVHDYSHAKAVAAATATAAEAAILAAKAAAEVVRLTRSGRLDYDPTRAAAVVIQSVFRGYLARRALRALRALVRLQALVRGYIVRKRAVDQVRRMHALIRAQERARTVRLHVPASSQSGSKTSHPCILEPSTPDNAENTWNTGHEQADKTKRNTSKSNRKSLPGNSKKFGEEKADKIVEVDNSAKRYNSTKNKNLFQLSANDLNINQIPATPFASEDFYLKYAKEIDNYSYYIADNSPRFHTGYRSSSAKRVRGSFAPANHNDFSGYTDHPNYMGYTKSSKAKSRSLSAPKQRTQPDRSSSPKSNSTHDYL